MYLIVTSLHFSQPPARYGVLTRTGEPVALVAGEAGAVEAAQSVRTPREHVAGPVLALVLV